MSQRSWIPRPARMLLIGVLVLIVGTAAWTYHYAQSRMAAIAYVQGHAAVGVEYRDPPSWLPRWVHVPPWLRSVHDISMHRMSCDLRRIVPLHEIEAIHLYADPVEEGFESVCSFPRLETLRIESAEITDARLAVVRKCRHLRRLVLDRTSITDDGLKLLSGMSLTDLELCHTHITNAGLKNLAGLRLEALSLNDTQITSEGLAHLSVLPLWRLDLEGTAIDDEGLEHLSRLPDLGFLNFARTKVTDAGVESLLACTELQILELYGTKVTDNAIPHLLRMKRLNTVFGAPSLDALRKLKAAGITAI